MIARLRPRRIRAAVVALGAAAACVVVIAGAALTSPPREVTVVGTEPLLPRFLPGDLPADMTLHMAFERDRNDGDAWIAILVDASQERVLTAEVALSPGDIRVGHPPGEAVDVEGVIGTVVAQEQPELWWSPSKRVTATVRGRGGVTREDLLRAARALRLRDGGPQFDLAIIEGFEKRWEGRTIHAASRRGYQLDYLSDERTPRASFGLGVSVVDPERRAVPLEATAAARGGELVRVRGHLTLRQDFNNYVMWTWEEQPGVWLSVDAAGLAETEIVSAIARIRPATEAEHGEALAAAGLGPPYGPVGPDIAVANGTVGGQRWEVKVRDQRSMNGRFLSTRLNVDDEEYDDLDFHPLSRRIDRPREGPDPVEFVTAELDHAVVLIGSSPDTGHAITIRDDNGDTVDPPTLVRPKLGFRRYFAVALPTAARPYEVIVTDDGGASTHYRVT